MLQLNRMVLCACMHFGLISVVLCCFLLGEQKARTSHSTHLNNSFAALPLCVGLALCGVFNQGFWYYPHKLIRVVLIPGSGVCVCVCASVRICE